jgi:hypothetical protein
MVNGYPCRKQKKKKYEKKEKTRFGCAKLLNFCLILILNFLSLTNFKNKQTHTNEEKISEDSK